MWKLAFCATFYYLFVFINSQSTQHNDSGIEFKKKALTCGQNLTHSSGGFHLAITNLTGGECHWIIEPVKGNYTIKINLFIHHLYLHEHDNVTIFRSLNDSKDESKSIVPPIYAQNGSLTIVTNETWLYIKLSGSDPSYIRNFDGYFASQNCALPLPPDLQIIHSPTYTTGITDIVCTYTFGKDMKLKRKMPVFGFKEFNFSTSSVELDGATIKGTYNHDPPIDFFPVDKTMTIKVIMRVPTNESYCLEMSPVDMNCSGHFQIDQQPNYMFQSPPEVLNDGSIVTECRWIFEHKNHDKILGLTLNKHHFDNPLDIIAINDGASEFSPPLMQVTTSNVNATQDQIVRTTTPYLWVSFKPKTYASFFAATVTVHGQGGHFKGNGSISVKTPTDSNGTVFLLEVDQDQTVLLNFTSSDFVYPETLSIYDGFDKSNILANLHGNVWYPVLSKSSKMMVIASSFVKGQFTATFSGVSPGCMHMNTISNDNYILSGNCNNTCMWIIPPQDLPGSELILNLQYLHLSKGDQLSIFKMDESKTPLGEVYSNMTHVPQMVFPASVGALVEINRAACEKESEDIVVVGHTSYLPACGQNLSLASLSEFQITSPMYPDTYPILASCSWQLNATKENLVHISFHSMTLAPNHCIKIIHPSDNKTMSFDGTKLPEDLLLPGNSVIKFDSSNCQGSKVATSLQSAEGFVLNGTVADCGADLSGKTSDAFSVVPNKTLCIWKVTVPETADNAKDIVNIISYSVSKKDEVGNYELLVYDGDSVREPRILNDTKSEIWSRTSSLIFIYKRIDAKKPSTILTVKYTTVGCNSTDQCANKICLHPDWRCNGINECGDFTDERNCQSVPIPPTPEKGGYSSTAFWVCIFLMLILGALLGIGIPYGYQKFTKGRYHRFDDLSAIH